MRVFSKKPYEPKLKLVKTTNLLSLFFLFLQLITERQTKWITFVQQLLWLLLKKICLYRGVKVFQLSDGKISARFWHIATRRQMWLQLKTVTPHANQPKQLPATSASSEVDTITDPFTQWQPSSARSKWKPQAQAFRQQTATWQTAKKEFIISVLIAFFILSKFQRQPDTPTAELGSAFLHVWATSFTNKQLFARNSIMPFNKRHRGSKFCSTKQNAYCTRLCKF